MTTSRRVLTVTLVLLVWTATACRLTPLMVGGDGPTTVDPEDAIAPADAADEDSSSLTLEQRLLQLCAADPGPLDAYASAAELTARLVGNWYGCDTPDKSSLQDGDGVGVTFNANGTWAVLFWNATHDGFDSATDPYNHGVARYHAFTDPDAGAAAEAGVGSLDVARGDTQPRNGLAVYLDRTGAAGPDPSTFTFAKRPRQMSVAELGPSALRARYVPID